jgi:transcription antitermination factor NusA-like protein
MRAADEVTHDVLIKAIAANSSNASLYRALTNVQTTILQITTKIETIVNNLTTMIKGYQLELNFKLEQEQMKSDDEEEVTVDNISSQHRGSKSFIEQMNKIESAEQMFESETKKQDD